MQAPALRPLVMVGTYVAPELFVSISFFLHFFKKTILPVDLFFERTALDECISIDIAEKYKIMSLKGHNQATKRKKKKTI